MYPEGWLIEPKGRWLLVFHKDSMCKKKCPQFYMDKWSCTISGTPNTFQNRRKVEIEAALETWNELIQNGWHRIGYTLKEVA